ncbi:MAG: hypothetical protein PUC44_00400 [Eubacteriales bacterium]|nr:hypothetical protein [Eubacteriales bacterium]
MEKSEKDYAAKIVKELEKSQKHTLDMFFMCGSPQKELPDDVLLHAIQHYTKKAENGEPKEEEKAAMMKEIDRYLSTHPVPANDENLLSDASKMKYIKTHQDLY